MRYQLDLRAQRLAQLVSRWKVQVSDIPPATQMPASWGPSEEQLETARRFLETMQCDVNEGNEWFGIPVGDEEVSEPDSDENSEDEGGLGNLVEEIVAVPRFDEVFEFNEPE